MRVARVKNVQGGQDDVKALTVSEFPFFQVPELTRHSKHKNITYLKTFATFDIETTTIRTFLPRVLCTIGRCRSEAS